MNGRGSTVGAEMPAKLFSSRAAWTAAAISSTPMP